MSLFMFGQKIWCFIWLIVLWKLNCPSCRMFSILFCDVSGITRIDPYRVIIWPSGKSLMSRFSSVCLNSLRVVGSS